MTTTIDWRRVWREAEVRYARAVVFGFALGELEQVVIDLTRWGRCIERHRAATERVTDQPEGASI